MKRVGLVLLLLLMTASCGSGDAPKKLVLTGSSSVAPLAAEIAKRFEALHPGVQVDVQSGGSGRGITDLRKGLSDIGLVSRALKDDERDLMAYPIAMDGICLIVHKDNAVPSLTSMQVVSIYTGRILNWKDVGGRDAPITVVSKAEGRSTLELFLAYFKLANPDVKAHVVIGDNQQGIKTVSGNPDAIGYVSIGAAEYEARHGAAIKLLPLDGVAATIDHVTDGSFPLSRPLNLVTRTVPEGLVKAFIDLARSAQVHDLVREQQLAPGPP
jgi:phosphate transport system substrate-binding protein